MIFVVVNPDNAADLSIFDNVDLAMRYLLDNGYKMVWSREIKISDLARFGYRNDAGREMHIFCKNLNGVYA